MTNFPRKPLALAVGIAAAQLLNPIAVAAQALILEEVTVTAQKREQGLQDVPVAVTAVSGEKINDIGITDLEEVTLYTPNVNINRGQAQPNIFIRGVGSGTNSGFEQSVGLYIDGVYSGRGQLATVPMTMDLERIEILKGPQGILFGKNTIGGAINVTSAKPSDEFEAMVDALYEPEDGEQIYNLMVSGPLTDNLSGRLAARYQGMDGWWDNRSLDAEGPDQDNLFLRGTLRWYASDSVEVLFKAEHGDFKVSTKPSVVYRSDFAGQTNFAGDVPFPLLSDHDEGAFNFVDANETDVDVAALTVNWELDFATFTSITARASYDLFRTQDSDFSPLSALHRTLNEEYEQYSQELRLVSPGGDTVDWIVGAYYQTAELDIARTNEAIDFALLGPLSVGALVSLPGSGDPVPTQFDQDSDSWAVFAQATWAVTDTVRLGLGLRYNEETKELDKSSTNAAGARAAALGAPELIVFSNPATQQSISDLRSHNFTGLERDEEKLTWMANVQWDATDDAMLYASVSTGFKGGGFDEAYSGAGESVRLVNPFTGAGIDADGDGNTDTVPGADPSVLNYDEETVLAYEMGAKMKLAGGAAELNMALFRMEYEDLQVSSLVGDVFRVGNAGEAISQGLEVDGRWLLTENLTLGASFAYLDAYYEEFRGATCTIPQSTGAVPGCETGAQDLTDRTLLFAPDWSANLNLDHFYPIGNNLELRTTLDLNYTDDFYSALDLDPATVHNSYTKVNLRVGIATTDDKWSVAVIAKNLTDKKTRVWNNDVPVTNSGSYFGVPERPRSVAIQGRYRF